MFGAKDVFRVLSGAGLRLDPSVAAKLAMYYGMFFVPVLTDMEERNMGSMWYVWYEAGVMANYDGDIRGIYVKIRIYNEGNDVPRDFYYVAALKPIHFTVPAGLIGLKPWEYKFWRGAYGKREVEIPVLPAVKAKEILEEMKSYAEKHPYVNLLPNGNKLKW